MSDIAIETMEIFLEFFNWLSGHMQPELPRNLLL